MNLDQYGLKKKQKNTSNTVLKKIFEIKNHHTVSGRKKNSL